VSPGDVAAFAGLGAFHGLNPAMGWLFAVALGLQDGSRHALLRALPPIAAGHAASVALTVGLIEGAQVAVSPTTLRLLGAVALAAFAVWKLARACHPRWVGFRIRPRELVLWSFLMATAHGAGLMLFPFLVTDAHFDTLQQALSGNATAGAAAVAVHTAAMMTVTAALAVAVYETVGVGILRSAWINVDRLWAGALLAGAVATLLA
jgi:hypothetical protein